ncbi:hypothetical protein [Cryobacterium sp. BB736]|uniref:hypothetical protein n=1 Tax=Cryobacterium sp. BB736 TaxID=2746963 RepID=UPI00187730CD|nr:hypothetical protein [Cryobacterium sp. BB736]
MRQDPNLGEWRHEAAKRLSNCLHQLRAVHLAADQTIRPWNANWIIHVGKSLDRLQSILDEERALRPDASISGLLHEFTYPAFGLPTPTDGLRLRGGRASVGRDVVDALSEWWGSEEQVTKSIALIQKSSGRQRIPLRDLNWQRFNQRLAATSSTLQAWRETVAGSDDAVRALARLSETEFFSPVPASADAVGYIALVDDEGNSLSTDPRQPGGTYNIVRLSGEGQTRSEPIVAHIPTVGSLSPQDVETTTARLVVSGTAFEWSGELRLEEGRLVASGAIQSVISLPKEPQIIELAVEVLPGDSLFGNIPGARPARIVICPSGTAGVVAFELQRNGSAKRYVIEYVEEEREDFGSISLDLDNAIARYRVVAWSLNDGTATHDGRRMQELHGRNGFFVEEFIPQGSDLISVSDASFELRASENAAPQFSPLASAIIGQHPTTDVLPISEAQSLRGSYENEATARRNTPEWLTTLGHAALPSSDAGSMKDLVDHAGVLMPSGLESAWDEQVGLTLPQSLVESAEAEEFRQAFDALDAFGQQNDPEVPEHARWPSRLPRRRLAGSAELARYLDSYSDLVSAARASGNPFGLFWASYPFSISAWSFGPDDSGCKSVLLSPLHPIRLAWSAAAEATLWEATNAAELAGTVHGFGFPIAGPSEHSDNGMLAVPADSGVHQIFLGWSQLVEASVGGFKSLSAPARIGATSAPGSSVSGLNANAVTAALKNYRRMNPHVTSLTIDLASQSQSPRLTEIDEAVVSALQRWEKTREERLPGGARILDSTNRLGMMPVEQATTLTRTNDGVPFSWSRYSPSPGETATCNVRLLQDAGVRVRVKDSNGDPTSVIADIPLRRFEASLSSSEAVKTVISRPGVEAAGNSFSQALRVIEGQPQIESQLFGALLVDESADWTVAGETMLSPGAVSSMIDSEQINKMLWEWRPPIFESSGGTSWLDRKPYVSVARIPMSFSRQIGEMLSKARGQQTSEADAQALFSTLGSRGVGLSSLLAMGGTHASGALGFYLGFALLDRVVGDSLRFVLPIDACDSFLMALAGESSHGPARQRADLLLIELGEEGVTMAPIEIKFYGLGAETPSHSLPLPSSAAFGEPLGQLANTVKLLRGVVDREESLRAEDDAAGLRLWANGLASLIEAASRMTPSNPANEQALRERLNRVVNGNTAINIGQPMVLYFNHDASFENGDHYRTFIHETDEPLNSFGALVSDSAAAFDATHSDDGALVEDWRSVVEWALAHPAISPTAGARVSSEAQEVVAVPSTTTARSSDRDSEPESVPSTATRPTAIAPSDTARIDRGVHFPVGRVLGSIGDGFAFHWPSNTELNQMNIGVVGDLGTGKTQLLKALVYQLRDGAAATQDNPVSLFVLDYKRDFQDDAFLEAVGGSVLRPHRIPLNFFALDGSFTPQKAVQRATMFSDVIAKIYGGVGPVQRTNLVKAIVGGYSGPNHTPPTIAAVLAQYEALSSKPDSVSSILTNWVMGEIFSDNPDELLSFEELITDKVLILALSDLGVDQEGKNALVALFLNIYYDYMLRSTKWPFVGTKPQLRRLNSYLLIDEATNIMSYEFPVLMQLMLQGREFGFGTILASQYLSHFRTAKVNYGEPLLTWFIHKVPNVSSKELSMLGIKGVPEQRASQIGSLAVHQALYSSLEYEGVLIAGTPFYKLVDELPEMEDETVQFLPLDEPK